MKGGITSGIVYPGLVSRLAAHYEFKSIGGTSAGAIAASLTAAAEYARSLGVGTTEPFLEVGKVPGWLGADSPAGGGSNLFHLFQPQPAMQGLFNFAVAFLIASWQGRLGLWAKVFWLEILLGMAPAAALVYLAHGLSGARLTVAVFLGVLVAIAGVVVTAVFGILLRAARFPTSGYGFCTGFEKQQKSKTPTLIEWLNERLNTIAGKSSSSPLTFGDLNQAGVTLRMMTTCLTWGRPFTLPFESAQFFYSPAEFRRFFPNEVVSWMEHHPCEFAPHEPVELGDLKPLPDADDLPVIVAARLSLSFPILFCAVPLYAIDYTRRRREVDEKPPSKPVPGGSIGANEARQPERVWFSDGGLTSNFPLHLFDEPLPRWPTFGINLRDLRPDLADPNCRIWMPTTNRGGIAQLWMRLQETAGLGGLFGFVGAMFDSARNWTDTLQTFAPGYRDRVVHISLDDRQGGLNLNMPEDVVASLSQYGQDAADKLIDHFINGLDKGEPTPMTWNNHRWIRYRTSIASLEMFLSDLNSALETPELGDQSYLQLINRSVGAPPTSYKLSDDQREYAPKITAALMDLGKDMEQEIMQDGAPKPSPHLKVRPSF